MFTRPLLFSTLVTGLASPVLAQSTAPSSPRPPADSAAQQLARMVTTATRGSASADVLPQRIVTIERTALERTPLADVTDALKKLAGVDVVQYPGLLASVSVRGFRPSTSTQTRTLILIDGRPAGNFNLSLLDLAAVERIEVLKGPASALYGSSAVGGVVNVITRRATGALRGQVSAAYGSFATSDISAFGGGVLARPFGRAVDADLSLRRYEQGDNFRLGADNVFRSRLGGDRAVKVYTGTTRPSRPVDDREADGVEREFSTMQTLSGSARVGLALWRGYRVDARAEQFRADDVLSPGDLFARESTSPGNNRKNVVRRSEEVSLRRDPTQMLAAPGWQHVPLLRVFQTTEESENYNVPGSDGFINFTGTTRTKGLQLQHAVQRGGQAVTVGLDATEIDEQSSRFARTNGVLTGIAPFSPFARQRSTAGFAQWQWRVMNGRVSGTMGGRLDDVALTLRTTPFRPEVRQGTASFTVFNPSAGVQVELGRGVRAHGTAGRAFLNPGASSLAGFSESVSGGVASITIGNPSLAPEHSVTVDGGLTFTAPQRGVTLDVTYFATSVDNRISTARAAFPAARRPTTPAGVPIASITSAANAGDAQLRGFEFDLRFDVARALGRSSSLVLALAGTRLFRYEERTPTVVVDTTGLAGVANLDARAVFDRVRLDDTRRTTIDIRNVSPLTLTGSLEYDNRRRVFGRLGARYVGRRFDTDFTLPADPSDIEYAPFLVLDASAGVRLYSRYRLEGLISNLTDENYYEKRGYNLPGRALQLRWRAEF